MKKAIFNLKPVVLVTLLLFAFLNLGIGLLNHYYFRTFALDYAIYNFAFFDYAHFRITPCPAYIFSFPATFLQDHFSLTLMFLAPLYWVITPFAHTYGLFILQWIFIVVGAVATYKLIEKRSGDYRIALAALVYYFVLYGRYSAYIEDVNLAIMGSATIPLFLYFFDQRKSLPLALTFIFLLFNREDYSLWLIFISGFLVIIGWKDPWKKRTAVILFLFSVFFFIFVFKVIIPGLEDENKKYSLFDFTIVGSTPLQAFVFIVTHPLEAIRLLFVNHWGENYYDFLKRDFYILYLVSGGAVLLYKPYYLIPFIPILAKKMYDDNPLRWSIETYYSIEFVSIMPVLVFYLISSLPAAKIRNSLAVLVCIVTCGMTVYKMLVPPGNPIIGQSEKFNVLEKRFYQPWVNVNEVKNVIREIPEDSPVAASCRLVPHLAYREKIYYFPIMKDADYVILFKEGDYYPLSKEDYEKKIGEINRDPQWRLVRNTEDVLLYKRLKTFSLR